MRSDCHTLNTRAFGVAAGIVAATLSAICATALLVAPGATRAVMGYLVHADLSGLAPAVSWASMLFSVIGWGLLAGIAFAAAAGLYNGSVVAIAERDRASVSNDASRA